jgi:hypothetical protein
MPSSWNHDPEEAMAMQVVWMVLVTLGLALGGVLGLALGSHVAAWARRRGSHRPDINRTAAR